MPLLSPDEKTELQYNVETLCLVSKYPVINKLNSGTDFIKFGRLSLLLGNINWNIIVFLKIVYAQVVQKSSTLSHNSTKDSRKISNLSDTTKPIRS